MRRDALPDGNGDALLDELEIAVVRGNAAEIATLAGREAEIRGVESIGAADSGADLARAAAEVLGTVAAVTGPTDYVSDGERVIAVSNGHELLGAVSGTGCMSTAITGAFRREAGSAARSRCRGARGVRRRRRGGRTRRQGPGTFHALLYDALYNLDPDTLDSRARVQE